MKITKELFETYGIVAVLLAYFLLSFNILEYSNVSYNLLNLTGASAIVYITVKKKLLQPMVLNIVWALIAIVALVGVVLK